MKAYRVSGGGGNEGLVQVELPDAGPGQGEVLGGVGATALN